MNEYLEIENDALAASTLEQSARVLERLLTKYAVWDDGSLYGIKFLVDRFRGLCFDVHPREHPPPHFHVRGNGIDASFVIADCSFLNGNADGRERRVIQWWYEHGGRALLISSWNDSRPGDCSVGNVDS